MNGFAGHKGRSTTKEIERHYPHIVEFKGAIERFRSQAERNACLVHFGIKNCDSVDLTGALDIEFQALATVSRRP
jgi:hypothetical protein